MGWGRSQRRSHLFLELTFNNSILLKPSWTEPDPRLIRCVCLCVCVCVCVQPAANVLYRAHLAIEREVAGKSWQTSALQSVNEASALWYHSRT